MKLPKIEILPILLVNFIGSLGISIVIPFLVVLVYEFGGNAFMYGLVAAMYPLFQFIGAPILGQWSDAWGRRPVLLLSQAGTLLSWFIFLVAFYMPLDQLAHVDVPLLGSFLITVPLLVMGAARALDGITGGNVSVAQAYLADISTKANRQQRFGWFQMAGTIGFTFGPVLAGLLASTVLEEQLPVMAAIAISLFALVAMIFFLPETKRFQEQQRQQNKTKEKTKVNFREVFVIPQVGLVIFLYFLLFIAFNIYYTAFPTFVTQVLSWSAVQMGLYFALLSLMMAIVQGPGLKWLSQRFSELRLIRVGYTLMGFNFLLVASGQLSLMYLALFFFALGNGIGWPSLLSYLSNITPDDKQGLVHGTAQSGASIAGIIGLLGGGILFEIVGRGSLVTSAILVVIVLVLSRFLKSS